MMTVGRVLLILALIFPFFTPAHANQCNIYDYQKSALNAVELLQGLEKIGVTAQLSSDDAFGIEILQGDKTPLNQLAKRLAPILVEPIFNSCRTEGICSLPTQKTSYLVLDKSDIGITENDIPYLITNARISRDLTDSIDVIRAFMYGDIGKAGIFKESIEYSIGRFQNQYKYRHINRKQRRFRLRKDQVAKTTKTDPQDVSDHIIRQTQLKEQEFVHQINDAIKALQKSPDSMSDQEHLATLLSGYLEFTGIPNKVVKEHYGVEILINPISEAEWLRGDVDFVDGVIAPDFKREYPELLKVASIASAQGYKVKFNLSEIVSSSSQSFDADSQTYYLKVTSLFTEFFYRRNLLSASGFRQSAWTYANADQDEAPFSGFIGTIQGLLTQLRWFGRSKYGAPFESYAFYVDPVIQNLRTALVDYSELLKGNEEYSESLVDEAQKAIDEFERYRAAAESMEDPRIGHYNSLKHQDQVDFKNRWPEGFNELWTPYNRSFHPDHANTGPEFNFRQLADKGHHYWSKEGRAVLAAAKKAIRLDPKRLGTTYDTIKSKLLSNYPGSDLIKHWFRLVVEMIPLNSDDTFRSLYDLIERSPNFEIKLKAIRTVLKYGELHRLRVKEWLNNNRTYLLQPNIKSGYSSSDPDHWYLFTTWSFSKLLAAVRPADPGFVDTIVSNFYGRQDELGKEIYYAVITEMGYQHQAMLNRALSTDIYYMPAWSYMARVGKNNPRVTNALFTILFDYSPSNNGNHDYIKKIIESLDELEARATPQYAQKIHSIWLNMGYPSYYTVPDSWNRLIFRCDPTRSYTLKELYDSSIGIINDKQNRKMSMLHIDELLQNIAIMKKYHPNDTYTNLVLARMDDRFLKEIVEMFEVQDVQDDQLEMILFKALFPHINTHYRD